MKSVCFCLLLVVSSNLGWGQQTQVAQDGTKIQSIVPDANLAAASAADPLQKLEAHFQQLQDELKQRDAALEQMKQEMQALRAALTEAEKKIDASVVSEQGSALDLEEIHLTLAASAKQIGVQERRLSDLQAPSQLRYRGVTITPGGFVSLVGIERAHNMNADSATAVGAIPLAGTMNSHLSEFRLSARQSRLAARVEGDIHGMKVTGYVETDFLGVGENGSSETQTNAFVPRLRLAFAEVELPSSLYFTAGQSWSLLQTTRLRTAPFTEFLPMGIDNNYLAGFSNARQGSFRVGMRVNSSLSAAFAVENPQMVLNFQCAGSLKASAMTSCPTIVSSQSATAAALGAPVTGFQNGSQTSATPGNGFAQGSMPSSNLAPDLVAKLAYDSNFGHYEIKAVGKFFRDRVYPNFYAATKPAGQTAGAFNDTAEGGGIGFGAVLPLIKNKLDFVAQGLGGRGIGRYSPGSGVDVTLRTNGTVVPVLSYQAMAGFEAHPNPKLDLYAYGGNEYYQRTTYTTTSPLFGAKSTSGGTPPIAMGYGVPYINDSQYDMEVGGTSAGTTSLSSCSSPNRDIWELMPGLWYRVWKDKAGTLQFGSSYSYIHRRLWSGMNGGDPVSGATVNPIGIQNMTLVALRFYLP